MKIDSYPVLLKINGQSSSLKFNKSNWYRQLHVVSHIVTAKHGSQLRSGLGESTPDVSTECSLLLYSPIKALVTQDIQAVFYSQECALNGGHRTV